MLPATRSRRRPLGALIAGFLLVLIAAAPALADVERGHTGTVGFHALRDGSTRGGAICRYKGIDPSPGGYSYEGKLKWIDVRPPMVRAISGSQDVGWRFIVQRRASSGSGFTSWSVRYRSPIQHDVTNTTTNASFSMMGINVNVPTSSNDDSPYLQYRVLVKMFWFRGDGTVQGTATHLVEWYKSIWNNWPLGDGVETNVEDYPCSGWVGIEIN